MMKSKWDEKRIKDIMVKEGFKGTMEDFVKSEHWESVSEGLGNKQSNYNKSKTPVKTLKKRINPKGAGNQIYNEDTKRWNNDNAANRKKILTLKKIK